MKQKNKIFWVLIVLNLLTALPNLIRFNRMAGELGLFVAFLLYLFKELSLILDRSFERVQRLQENLLMSYQENYNLTKQLEELENVHQDTPSI